MRRYEWPLLLGLASCAVEGSAGLDGAPMDAPDGAVATDLGFGNLDSSLPPIRCLSYSPFAYFHEVTLGREAWLRFAIRNGCREARVITAVDLFDPEGAFAVDALPLPFTLGPDEVLKVSVRFAPRAPRDYEAQVAIHVDDPGQPEFRVRVTGVGVGGELRAFPVRLELESATVGCRTSSRTVGLWNEGPGPMYVFSVGLEGPDASAFRLQTTAQLPRDVPAYEGLAVELSFEPTRPGPHEASLIVTYNGRESPGRVPIAALASPTAEREESFAISERPKHDLVFLVPPLSVARGEREAFLDFAREMKDSGAVDLRLIVTPAGGRDVVLGVPVACPGFPAWLDLDEVEASLLEVLVPCMLSVAGAEDRPRSSAVLVAAVEGNFAGEVAETTVLRPDATTHFVFTTFDDEWKVPLPLVLSFLDSTPLTRPRALMVHAYEVPTPSQPSVFGARHHAMVEATGGRFIGQEDSAWRDFFTALGDDMTNGARPISLASTPRAASLEVTELTGGATLAFSLGVHARRLYLPEPEASTAMVRYEASCEP